MNSKVLVILIIACVLATQVVAQEFFTNILRNMIHKTLDKLFYVGRDANSTGSVNGFAKKLLGRLRNSLRTGNPKVNLPVVDPFKVPPISQSFNQYSVNVNFNLPNLMIYGLSTYNIRNLDIDMDNRKMALEMNMGLLNGTGNFSFSGSAAIFFSISGAGVISIQLRNIFIDFNVTLTATPDEKLQIENLYLDLTIGSINIDIPKIVGGGTWSSILQLILSAAGPSLFNGLRKRFLGPITNSIKNVTNKALDKIPRGLYLPERMANRFVDKVLEIIMSTPQFKKLDRINLPDFQKSVPFVASMNLYEGRVDGLNNMKRTGDIVYGGMNDTLMVAGALGIQDLAIKYSGTASIGFISRDVVVHGSVSRVSIAFMVSISADEGAHPQLDEFKIIELSPIMLSFRTNLILVPFFINLVSAGLSVLITPILQHALTGTIKKVIAQQLQNLTLPI